VKAYSAPIDGVASSTAAWIVRRGLRASSASGAAPSKPPNARIVKTDPAITPFSPWKPGGVYFVVKTLRVLWPPAWITSSTPMIRKTAISKTPSTVPSLADVLTP